MDCGKSKIGTSNGISPSIVNANAEPSGVSATLDYFCYKNRLGVEAEEQLLLSNICRPHCTVKQIIQKNYDNKNLNNWPRLPKIFSYIIVMKNFVSSNFWTGDRV